MMHQMQMHHVRTALLFLPRASLAHRVPTFLSVPTAAAAASAVRRLSGFVRPSQAQHSRAAWTDGAATIASSSRPLHTSGHACGNNDTEASVSGDSEAAAADSSAAVDSALVDEPQHETQEGGDGQQQTPSSPERRRRRGGRQSRMSPAELERYRAQRRDAQQQRNRAARQEAEARNRFRMPQPVVIERLLHDLYRLALTNNTRATVDTTARATAAAASEQTDVTTHNNNRQPDFHTTREQARSLLDQALKELQSRARGSPTVSTQLTLPQWTALLLACKNHALYQYALPLHQLLVIHLQQLDRRPALRQREAAMCTLPAREVNVLLECVARADPPSEAHALLIPAEEAKALSVAAAGDAASTDSSHARRLLTPFPYESYAKKSSFDTALDMLLRHMYQQHGRSLGALLRPSSTSPPPHFEVTGAAAGVLLGVMASTSPSSSSAGAASAPSSDDASAGRSADQGLLERVRACYDAFPAGLKDASTHSVMLSIYLKNKQHAAMRDLFSSLQESDNQRHQQRTQMSSTPQPARKLAPFAPPLPTPLAPRTQAPFVSSLSTACYGAMLSSLYMQLEEAEPGSQAAQAMLTQAEKLWRRVRGIGGGGGGPGAGSKSVGSNSQPSVPTVTGPMDAFVTATMLRICALVWDTDRQISVLQEALRLEQQHTEAWAQHEAEQTKRLENGPPFSAEELAMAKATVVAPANSGVGFVYVTPACVAILLHSLATRLPRPSTAMPQVHAAWAVLEARHAEALDRGHLFQERAKLLDPAPVLPVYAKVLHEAGQTEALFELWNSLPRAAQQSQELLLLTLKELSSAGRRDLVAQVRLQRDERKLPWSTASRTALMSVYQRKDHLPGGGPSLPADVAAAEEVWASFEGDVRADGSSHPPVPRSARSYAVLIAVHLGLEPEQFTADTEKRIMALYEEVLQTNSKKAQVLDDGQPTTRVPPSSSMIVRRKFDGDDLSLLIKATHALMQRCMRSARQSGHRQKKQTKKEHADGDVTDTEFRRVRSEALARAEGVLRCWDRCARGVTNSTTATSKKSAAAAGRVRNNTTAAALFDTLDLAARDILKQAKAKSNKQREIATSKQQRQQQQQRDQKPEQREPAAAAAASVTSGAIMPAADADSSANSADGASMLKVDDSLPPPQQVLAEELKNVFLLRSDADASSS